MSPAEAAVQEAAPPSSSGTAAAACEPLQSQAHDSVAIFQRNWQASVCIEDLALVLKGEQDGRVSSVLVPPTSLPPPDPLQPNVLLHPLHPSSLQVYQKLLAVDFLFHNSLYNAVEEALLSRWGSGCATHTPLAMLDLGCGDAQQAAATLARCGAPSGALRLASYTGVDVSPPALAIARRNLAFLQPACSVSFVQHDMASFVEACPAGQYDLVFASFAVHHLSLEGKAGFLRAAARCLRPGGAFVLVDVFLREGEDRARWLARFRAHMQEAVDTRVIDAEEAATVMGHIEPFDFPEHVSTYQRMAAAAGFAAADCVHTDPKEFSRVMVLRTDAQ